MIQPDGIWKTYNLLNKNNYTKPLRSRGSRRILSLPEKTLSIFVENHWKIHRMTLPQIFDGLSRGWCGCMRVLQNVYAVYCRRFHQRNDLRNTPAVGCFSDLQPERTRSQFVFGVLWTQRNENCTVVGKQGHRLIWMRRRAKPNVGLSPLRAGQTHIRANVHETIFDNASSLI